MAFSWRVDNGPPGSSHQKIKGCKAGPPLAKLSGTLHGMKLCFIFLGFYLYNHHLILLLIKLKVVRNDQVKLGMDSKEPSRAGIFLLVDLRTLLL